MCLSMYVFLLYLETPDVYIVYIVNCIAYKTEGIPRLFEGLPRGRPTERCGSSQESHERIRLVYLCFDVMILEGIIAKVEIDARNLCSKRLSLCEKKRNCQRLAHHFKIQASTSRSHFQM